jgi:uncharacterized protein YdeI (YjbR/CyaY-like superfamily)
MLELENDDEVRTVTVPRDLAKALSAGGARKMFDAMSYTCRKEWVRAVEEAKKPETRRRRIEKAVSEVLAKPRRAMRQRTKSAGEPQRTQRTQSQKSSSK